MMQKYTIEKLFIPCQDTNTTTVALKVVQDSNTGSVYVGIGDDEWVFKNGIPIENLNMKSGV